MTVFAIQMYGGDLRLDDSYCGCWHVPCPADDPAGDELDRLGFGRFLDEAGVVRRAFFLADEVDAQVVAAELETGCYVEAVECDEVRRPVTS